ncbi:MAG: hypothetical protein Q9170_002963, partial [Blastenia crenularia]
LPLRRSNLPNHPISAQLLHLSLNLLPVQLLQPHSQLAHMPRLGLLSGSPHLAAHALPETMHTAFLCCLAGREGMIRGVASKRRFECGRRVVVFIGEVTGDGWGKGFFRRDGLVGGRASGFLELFAKGGGAEAGFRIFVFETLDHAVEGGVEVLEAFVGHAGGFGVGFADEGGLKAGADLAGAAE